MNASSSSFVKHAHCLKTLCALGLIIHDAQANAVLDREVRQRSIEDETVQRLTRAFR